MKNLSMVQALGIWSELEDCRNGTNGFGGKVAEIYLYRLSPYITSGMRMDELEPEDVEKINTSFFELLEHFAVTRSVGITVDGEALGPWLKTSINTHRVHVEVAKQAVVVKVDDGGKAVRQMKAMGRAARRMLREE